MRQRAALAFFSLFLFLSACTPQRSMTALRIAVLPVIDTLPMYVAQQENLFARHGVSVEFIPVASAPERDQLLAAAGADGTVNETLAVMLFNKESVQMQVVRYASVNDVGRVVNPMIVRGQLDGGAVQGIGQALCEHMVYDADSGQPLTGSLMDYAAPRADVIACEFVTEMNETVPSKNNPLGVKGVGELGTIGAAPSVVNAVADALARAGKKDAARTLQMPLAPAKVWQVLQA